MDEQAIISKIKGFLEEKEGLEIQDCYFLTKKINEEYWEEIKESEEEPEEEDEEDYSDFEDQPEEEEDEVKEPKPLRKPARPGEVVKEFKPKINVDVDDL